MSKQKRHTRTWAQYRPSQVKSSTAHRLGSMSAHIFRTAERARAHTLRRADGGSSDGKGRKFRPFNPTDALLHSALIILSVEERKISVEIRVLTMARTPIKWAFRAVFALHFGMKHKNGAENPDKLEFSAISALFYL